MLAIRKMGPIGNLLGMLPGAGQMKDALAAVDDSQLDRVQAIIRGMTPAERADPKIINASRRLRIANGSGVTVVGGQSARRPVLRGPQDDVADGRPDGNAVRPQGFFAQGRQGQEEGQEGQEGRTGPTPPKVRNPLGARRMPAGFPDLSNMPKGLDELPPGLADIDLSKLKFPGKK